MRRISCMPVLALALALGVAPGAGAATSKVGMSISVDGDGFLDPVVKTIRVTDVAQSSLAEAAGLVAGDEIVQIEGHDVVGRRASELKPFLTFNPGETRTLRLRHANGEQFDARITKPKAP